MRVLSLIICIPVLISFSACQSFRGNVVPQTGPTMEQVYDEVDKISHVQELPKNSKENKLKTTKKEISVLDTHSFHKIPNPELHMYVYPHLAGNAELPIPGYETVFHAYERDHYAMDGEF